MTDTNIRAVAGGVMARPRASRPNRGLAPYRAAAPATAT